MKIRFTKRNPYGQIPCVWNDVVSWHSRHGWCWEVKVDGVAVAVFYCTLLCGDGCLVHFDKAEYVKLPGAVILGIMRKAMRMIEPECDVIYATIEKQNEKLIHVAIRLGFGLIPNGGFLRDGKTEVVLLKFYPETARYIKK
jgi:hypothetical protein